MKAAAVEISERELQDQVVELARIRGWMAMHVRRSIGKGKQWTTATSVVGWPDLVLVRPPRLLFVELKAADGKLTSDQERVLATLRGLPHASVHVWRPSDWDEIVRTLT